MLHGIDVSNNNGVVDWVKAAAAPVDFAFVKASEGIGYYDPLFTANWTGIKAAGIGVRGVYHFCHPELNSPEQEAEWYTRIIAEYMQPGDIPVLDCEVGGTQDNSGWLMACGAAVGKILGFPCGVYSYLDYIQRCLQDSGLAAMWLWLAAYGSQMPASPVPWDKYLIWQYSQSGTIPGISGNCDLNQADCTIADLQRLGKPFPIVAHAARVKVACSLKSLPCRKAPSRVLAEIPGPPHGLIIDTGERHTTGANTWGRVQFRDMFGWIIASNIRKV